jgi:DNA polymerase-1
MAEKFFLIDGHSHLYRAFFAVRGLTTPEGQPSNAVYGFTAMLRKILREYRPDYLAVAFDMPGPTFRHKKFEAYKATREKPPDEFRAQIPMTRELLEAYGIPVFNLQGYEADDIMGTLARQATEKGIETVLVTSDKDARQLLGPSVTILDGAKDRFITEKDLREQGIEPGQVIEMMALSGDTSDNVPGVPKVGPKTALNLIKEYGTLENVLAHVDDIQAPALRENLKTHEKEARLSRELVTIDLHVPVEADFEACRVTPPDPQQLIPIFRRFGFQQFLSEIELKPTRETADYQLVDDDEAFAAFLRELGKQNRFSIDLETTGTDAMSVRIVGLSFSWEPKSAWYLPVRGPLMERTLSEKKVLDALRPILTDPAVAKVGQNIKYDSLVLRRHGIEVKGIAFDTMVAAYVINPERRRYGLDDLALSLLDYRMIPIADLIGKGKKQITMDKVPVATVCEYACADADITWRLVDILEAELRRQEMAALFRDVEMPLVSVLTDMEYQGIALDAKELEAMSGRLAEQMASIEKDVYKEAGKEFNIGSPKQLSHILFDKLGLPKGRRTKTGASTDSDVLEELAVAHRLPGLVLEYRQLSKLKSTYVDALPRMVNPETGRIHTSFNQTAVATGRLSSSDPNLQNIPIRTELGEAIRKAFVTSRPEHLLLTADYSQIELRVLAHISGDLTLRQAFAEDADIHRFVAAQINGVRQEEVTSTMRRAAKAVNFGIVYGLTPYGLSRDLRIPVPEATRFINDYFERYPGVKAFIDRTVEEARKAGYVATLLGRKRPIPTINDPNHAVRSFAERAAVNTVIQGTAADMIKLAMIRIHRRLNDESFRAKMLLQIHDELLFELPSGEQDRLTAMITEEMSSALKLDVAIKVNVAVGRNWMESK